MCTHVKLKGQKQQYWHNLKCQNEEINDCNALPWFSWEEWQNVYQNIYGNKIEDWRKAYDQISVWKSRVSKLAVGIECTIPLLHAQIAQADPSMNESFKNSILNIAIIRFVSIVTKGYEIRYVGLDGRPMQGVSNVMNLPPFLINIRNVMVHSDIMLGSSQTLKSALETSLQWIKLYYWEEEDAKIWKQVKRRRLKANRKKSTHKATSIKPVKGEVPSKDKRIEDFHALKRSIQDFLDQFVNYARRPTEVNSLLKERKAALKEEIKIHFYYEPENCMKVLVARLFYAPEIQKLLRFLPGTTESRRSICHCKCFLEKGYLLYLSFLLNFIFKLHSINIFLTELVNRGMKHPFLCVEWIRLLMNSVNAFSDSSICMQHRFYIFRPDQLRKTIRWRKLLYNLLKRSQRWSSELAFEMLDRYVVDLDPETKGILKDLSSIFVKAKSKPKVSPETDRDEVDMVEGLATLEDLIQESRKVSKDTFLYVKLVCDRVRKQVIKCKNRDARLGVLPHQVGDPYFYKQLILYPSEPQKKRLKRTHITSDA